MASVTVLTAEYILVNSVDWKSWASKAQLDVKASLEDVTTFASGGWKENAGGLLEWTVSIELIDDFTATTGLDALLWGILNTSVPIELRPTQAARGTANPAYTGNIWIDNSSFGGQVGTAAKKSLTFTGTGAVSRLTA